MFNRSLLLVIISFVIIQQFIVCFDTVATFKGKRYYNKAENRGILERIKRSKYNHEHKKHQHPLNSECITTNHTLGVCIPNFSCPEPRKIISIKNLCYVSENYTLVICCEQVKNGVPIFASELESETENNIDSVKVTTTTSSDNQVTDDEDGNDYTALHYNFTTLPPLTAEDIYAVMTKISKSVNEDIFERVKNSSKTSNRKCVENTLLKYDGTEDDGLFVGGVLAKDGDNPQIAAIGWKSWNNNIDWECGGSLISSTFILTAAHCTSYRGEAPYIVRVGDLNLLDNNDTVSLDFNITGIWTHPEYLPNLMYHDIALIRVSSPVPFTKYMKPGCLWTESDIPLKIVTGMGYGTESFGGKRTHQLYQGKLTIISNEVCEKALGIRPDIPNGIIDSQLCAKDPSGIADTCQGDSGAPLVFRTGSRSSTNQHLIGITSFGVSCASFFPGVYTRVSSYIDWIESIVWPEEIHRL